MMVLGFKQFHKISLPCNYKMQDIYNETQQAKLLSLLFANIRKCFCFIDLLLFFYRTVYYFVVVVVIDEMLWLE